MIDGDITIVFSCSNCGHEIHIQGEEELSNPLNNDCTFCIDGSYTQLQIFVYENETQKTIYDNMEV